MSRQNYDTQVKPNKLFKNERTSCAAQADCCGNMTTEGVRRGDGRRDLKKRGRGMKDRVDRVDKTAQTNRLEM